MSVLRAIVLLVVAALAAAGCNPLEPKACSAIGCINGLIVEVVGVPPGTSATVMATGPDGSSKSAPCLSTGTGCTAYLDGFMPATATLRLSWNSNTVEFEITPTYITTYPNGRDCPPACVQAHVPLTVSP